MRPAIPTHLPPSLQSLIAACWRANPIQRPGMTCIGVVLCVSVFALRVLMSFFSRCFVLQQLNAQTLLRFARRWIKLSGSRRKPIEISNTWGNRHCVQSLRSVLIVVVRPSGLLIVRPAECLCDVCTRESSSRTRAARSRSQRDDAPART